LSLIIRLRNQKLSRPEFKKKHPNRDCLNQVLYFYKRNLFSDSKSNAFLIYVRKKHSLSFPCIFNIHKKVLSKN